MEANKQVICKDVLKAKIISKMDDCLCKNADAEITIELKHLIDDEKEEIIAGSYMELLADKNAGSKLFRFAVYYCIFSYYVEVSCINKMYELIEKFGEEFKEFAEADYDASKYVYNRVNRFVAHNYSIYSQYYIFKYRESDRPQDYEDAVKFAGEAITRIEESRGVYQNYAGIIAQGYESGYVGMAPEYMENALKYIRRAIGIKPDYGLYYCTLGRLLAIQRDYKEAEYNINKAIMLEDIDKNTSHRRIARYYMFLADVRLKKKEEEIEDIKNELIDIQKKFEGKDEEITDTIQKAKETIEENMSQQQVKNIELLTFFSGILALIITIAGSIGASDIFTENIGMIWSMGGIVILSFSLLFGIFDYVNLKKQKCSIWIVISFVLALLLLAGGILIGRCSY